MPKNKMIYMRHKSTKKGSEVARVSTSAFESIWKDKGWVEVDRKEATTPTTDDGDKGK